MIPHVQILTATRTIYVLVYEVNKREQYRQLCAKNETWGEARNGTCVKRTREQVRKAATTPRARESFCLASAHKLSKVKR